MIVVSNTSPICYLIIIGHIELLPTLFGEIHIPEAVKTELSAQDAPSEVKNWLLEDKSWLHIHGVKVRNDLNLTNLHLGEMEVISLYEKLNAPTLRDTDAMMNSVDANILISSTQIGLEVTVWPSRQVKMIQAENGGFFQSDKKRFPVPARSFLFLTLRDRLKIIRAFTRAFIG